MLYPYPKYNDEADAEAHVCAFLTTWQGNHVSQRLSEVDNDKSKIVEFRLSLEGKSANWYSRHEEGECESFKQLTSKKTNSRKHILPLVLSVVCLAGLASTQVSTRHFSKGVVRIGC